MYGHVLMAGPMALPHATALPSHVQGWRCKGARGWWCQWTA